jgi:hypothetical protein
LISIDFAYFVLFSFILSLHLRCFNLTSFGLAWFREVSFDFTFTWFGLIPFVCGFTWLQLMSRG